MCLRRIAGDPRRAQKIGKSWVSSPVRAGCCQPVQCPRSRCLWFHHADDHRHSSGVVSMACQGLPSDPDRPELHQLQNILKHGWAGGFCYNIAGKICINQNQSVCVEKKWIHCNFIRERSNAPKIALSSHALTSELSAILGLSFFELPNFE